MNIDLDLLVRFHNALGDGTRLKLLCLMASGPRRGFCVGRLAERLGVTPSAVSQHLAILHKLGLVFPTRRGRRVHYRLDRVTLLHYLEATRHFLCRCAPMPDAFDTGRAAIPPEWCSGRRARGCPRRLTEEE